jgi:hypothetical protein
MTTRGRPPTEFGFLTQDAFEEAVRKIVREEIKNQISDGNQEVYKNLAGIFRNEALQTELDLEWRRTHKRGIRFEAGDTIIYHGTMYRLVWDDEPARIKDRLIWEVYP